MCYAGGMNSTSEKGIKKSFPNNRHLPTTESLEIVRTMSEAGLSLAKIGEKLGTSPQTVRRVYALELEYLANHGGRPPYEVNPEDREDVEGMAMAGIKREDIARAIGISPDTLYRYYSDELQNTNNRKLGRIANNLARDSETPGKANLNAYFILKCKSKWRENDNKEIAENFTEVLDKIAAKLPD